jgi:hypothetical protein
MAHMYDCLTWPQMAELHVLTWPYSPNATVVCQAAAAMVASREQQQPAEQQQQQQEQSNP